MLEDSRAAERIAIENYGELIRFIGQEDATTRRFLYETLNEFAATGKKHADDLARRRHDAGTCSAAAAPP
jgi:bacterioferritin